MTFAPWTAAFQAAQVADGPPPITRTSASKFSWEKVLELPDSDKFVLTIYLLNFGDWPGKRKWGVEEMAGIGERPTTTSPVPLCSSAPQSPVPDMLSRN
jgi:hypothetical protein